MCVQIRWSYSRNCLPVQEKLVFVLCLWSSPINDKKSLPVGVVVATLAFSVGVVVLSLRSTISNSEDVDVAVLLLQQADSRLEVMVLDAEVLLAHTFDDVSATACRCSTKSFTTSWMIAQQSRTHPLYDKSCLLYTSPSPRDATLSRMPSSA